MTDSPTDETDLTPANQTGWYIMMTLCGEQHCNASYSGVDTHLHLQNRRLWNKWVAPHLTAEHLDTLRAARTEDNARVFSDDELTPFTPDEQAELERHVAAVCRERGVSPAMPSPDQYCDLSNSRFPNALCLSNLIFPMDVLFQNCRFACAVHASGAHFLKEFDISGATFEGLSYFTAASFGIYPKARYARFKQQAVFDGARVDDIFSCSGAQFDEGASFEKAVFSATVNFEAAEFNGPTRFSETEFNGSAGFRAATFRNTIRFEDCAFMKSADFSRARFHDEAAFVGCRFSAMEAADFSGATFSGPSSWLGTICKIRPTFRAARFENHPPSLVGLRIGLPVTGPTPGVTCDWADVNWPAPPHIPAAAPDTASDYDKGKAEWDIGIAIKQARADVDSYQHLKYLSEQAHRPREAQDFFAREMRARRVVDTYDGRRWPARFSALYDLVSDYGRSILRPLMAMAALFVPTAAIFEQTRRIGEGCAPLTTAQAWGTSIASLLSVLPGFKDMIAYTCLSPLATVTAGVNTVAGGLLLVLIGLALRNRFRMK